MRILCEVCSYEWDLTPQEEEAYRALCALDGEEPEEILMGKCWRHARDEPDYIKVRSLTQ